MNCVRCNTPLIEHARFCSKCGYPVVISQQVGGQQISSPSQLPTTPEPQATQTPQPPGSPVIPVQPMQPTLPAYDIAPTQPVMLGGATAGRGSEGQPPAPWAQPGAASPSPLPYFQGQGQAARARPAVVSPAKGGRRAGCLLGCVATVVLLLILLVAGWTFALRPYLNSMAVSQLDQAMNGTINQLTLIPFIPPGPVLVSESTLNTFITLNIPSSLPIQNTQAQISPAGIQITFQVYGLTGKITGVPKVVNGQLQLTNVTVNTLVSLILSPDDIANLINTHIATALTRIHHTVSNVVLKDHEMDMLLV